MVQLLLQNNTFSQVGKPDWNYKGSLNSLYSLAICILIPLTLQPGHNRPPKVPSLPCYTFITKQQWQPNADTQLHNMHALQPQSMLLTLTIIPNPTLLIATSSCHPLLYLAFCEFSGGEYLDPNGICLPFTQHACLPDVPFLNLHPPFCQSLKQIPLHRWKPYAHTQEK